MAEASSKRRRGGNTPPSIFYCYAQEDRAFVEELVKALDRRQLTRSVDFTSVNLGLGFTEATKKAIATRDWFLLILSPSTAQSPYNILSITLFAVEQKKPILAILIKDVELPDLTSLLISKFIRQNLWDSIDTLAEQLSDILVADPAPYYPPPLVYPTVDEVILFSKPSGSRNDFVKNLPFDSPLVLIDQIEDAQEKIGRSNQWLHVRDLEGSEGYVAAWYIALDKPVQPVPAPNNPIEKAVPKTRQPISENIASTQPRRSRGSSSKPKSQAPNYPEITAGRARGIDVSRFNESMDFQAAAKAGMDFAFIHDMAADEAYREHFNEDWENAKEAGLLRSLYHVFDPVVSPGQQAHSFRDYVGSDPGELPPTIDLEVTEEQLNPDLYDSILQFTAEVEKLFGKKPILYARPSLFNKLTDMSRYAQAASQIPYAYPLWIAYYPAGGAAITNPGRLLGDLPWAFWQYTDHGRLPGMEGAFDFNVYNGSPEELRKWAAGTSPGGPFITDVTGQAPGIETTASPRVLLQSVLLKDERVFNSQSAHFTLGLFNPADGTLWKRGERWQITAEWVPVDGGKTVSRQIEKQMSKNVEPGTELNFNVVVRAPNPLGEYQVAWSLRPVDWFMDFESQAEPLTVRVEEYQYPIDDDKVLPFPVECISIDPPKEWVKARKFPVNVVLANQGKKPFTTDLHFELHLVLRRQNYKGEQHAYQALEIFLPPGETASLTFEFQAPRLQGNFDAEWTLDFATSTGGRMTIGQRTTTLTLLPPPKKEIITIEDKRLPPRGAAQIEAPKAAQPYQQLIYQNFIQPVEALAKKHPDLHRLDIHLTPRVVDKTKAEEGWKYQVVLAQYEDENGHLEPRFYESPFELDETAAPMEELGTQRAGRLLFDGLFSTKQLPSGKVESLVPSTYDGLQRAMSKALCNAKDCLRLQVRLNNQTPAVHNYRWEYLWNPTGSEGGPLAASERFPFARVLHLAPLTGYIPSKISKQEPLRLLVAVASPTVLKGNGARPNELAGLGPITRIEVETLVESLQKVGSHLKFEVLWDASLDSLCDKLGEGIGGKPFQALHLLCHGIQGSVGDQACLVLQKSVTGEADLVSDRLFAQRLQAFPDLCLVVFASCLTALSTNHVPLQGVARYLQAKTSIPAVIAMQDLLQIESAQHFAQGFYRKLVDTGEVDRSANAGRRQIFDHVMRDFNHPLKGEVLPNQWGVPVLFLRILDGKLFNVSGPSPDKFEPGVRSLKDLSGEDLQSLTEALLRSTANQVSLQLNLALPNLGQSFLQALQQSRAQPEAAPKPVRLHIFGEPSQADQRWWLVWAAALYRKHPARRTVLYTRRQVLGEIARLLDRERLGKVSAAEFQKLVQQGGKALWYDDSQNPQGTNESLCLPVTQLLEAGPANQTAWPEEDLSAADLAPICLCEDNTHQPVLVNGKPARSTDWRIALRGFDSFTGGDPPLRVRLAGNLTWDTANAVPYDPQAYQQLLYGENPLQAFAALSQPGSAPVHLDAESAALALGAVYPDTYLPYRESHRQAVFSCLDLPGSTTYTLDYAGYCLLARDLLADGDLGLEDLVDVHFFLQRLADGLYSTAEELKRRASGQVRPHNLRTQLRPVEIDPEQVDSDLVIRQGVLIQAAAALNAGKHIILIGPPGTGKTTLAEDLCRYAHDRDFSRGYYLVTATADWTTFDTIGGYMPESGDRLTFRPGIFLEAIAAEKWLVIDEINRADIDKAFGELFTVLSGQAVTLPYKDEAQRLVRILPAGQTSGEDTRDYLIPRSWRIIGTMNIYDKASLFSMSYAFMRRFAFIDMPIPGSKAYTRLLDYFIQRHELKALVEAGKSTADSDLRKLFHTDGMENALMRHRAVGPAIARDILEYLRSRTSNGKAAFHHGHLAEALGLYVLPQLDRLEQANIIAIYQQLKGLFTDHAADPDVLAMLARIKELFPFISENLWGDP